MNEIRVGECLEEMKKMDENSISCIVTDPPYGLSFMGKDWDHGIPGIPFWKEALRVCKPGSFLLAFGGTRTFHRLTCAIEDAGWEIRDCISWLYGSGFPKSHNHFGIEGYGTALKPAWEPIIMAMKPCEGTFKQNAEKWGQAGINIAGCRIEGNWERSTPTMQDIRGNAYNSAGDKRLARAPQESHPNGRWPANLLLDEEAAQLLDEQSGISKSCASNGTALKPAWEPIIMAMKPCEGTFKQNAEKWGQAGINIDVCRIEHNEEVKFTNRTCEKSDGRSLGKYAHAGIMATASPQGRWPANLLWDEDAAQLLGAPSRFFYCAKASPRERNEGLEGFESQSNLRVNAPRINEESKFNTKVKNNHPTVKPLALMEYLIKLVMPPKDGILLDPFAGSGSTILAAKNLGVQAIGIEKSEEYCAIARARLQ